MLFLCLTASPTQAAAEHETKSKVGYPPGPKLGLSTDVDVEAGIDLEDEGEDSRLLVAVNPVRLPPQCRVPSQGETVPTVQAPGVPAEGFTPARNRSGTKNGSSPADPNSPPTGTVPGADSGERGQAAGSAQNMLLVNGLVAPTLPIVFSDDPDGTTGSRSYWRQYIAPNATALLEADRAEVETSQNYTPTSPDAGNTTEDPSGSVPETNSSESLASNVTTAFPTSIPDPEALREAVAASKSAQNGYLEAGYQGDLSYAHPFGAPTVWSTVAHDHLPDTGPSTSMVPKQNSDSLTDSRYIKDAHLSLFDVSPAVVVHSSQERERTLYINQSGTVRGFIDYRVSVPASETDANETEGTNRTSYCFGGTSVGETTLSVGETVIGRSQSGTVTPTIPYQDLRKGTVVADPLRLQTELNATVIRYVEQYQCSNKTEIEVEAEAKTRTGADSDTGSENDFSSTPDSSSSADDKPGTESELEIERCEWTLVDESRLVDEVTVSSTIEATVYDPQLEVYTAVHPDGQTLIAVYFRGPWRSVRIGPDSTGEVRGVWRFYGARDGSWQQLSQFHSDSLRLSLPENTTGTVNRSRSTVPSPAVPAMLHAFPTRVGPQPLSRSPSAPQIVSVWGADRQPPTVNPMVNVSNVSQPFTPSYGLEIIYRGPNTSSIRVEGLMPGSAPIVQSPVNTTREIRSSRLRMRILSINTSTDQARIRLTLEDTSKDVPRPITTGRSSNNLSDGSAPALTFHGGGVAGQPGAGLERPGDILINGKAVETGLTGRAEVTVTIPESGRLTARYRPGDWLSVSPAYASASTSVYISPGQRTPGGWVGFIRQFMSVLIAVFVLRLLILNLWSLIR